MGVNIVNGIGYSQRSGAVFFDMAAIAEAAKTSYNEPAAPIKDTVLREIGGKEFIPWGDDNREPIKMVSRIEQCGVLTGIIDDQSRFALGEGVVWAYVKRDEKGKQVIQEFADEEEITNFMEDNNHYHQEFGIMQDQIGLRQAVVRLMLSLEGDKIASFRRHDVAELRYEKMQQSGDRAGKSEYIYLCAEWDKVSDPSDERVKKIRLLDEDNPLAHLKEIRKDNPTEVEFAMVLKGHAWLKKYYPRAKWQSADKYLDQAIAIPAMKSAMFQHNFRPRYIVKIHKQFWENHFAKAEGTNEKEWEEYTAKEREDLKNKVYDKIDEHLSGVENHGKAIFVDAWIDNTGKSFSEIEIEAIDDKIKDGDLLPDSANANSELAFSMSYNPSINGTNLPSGPYTNASGGSSIREAVAVQIILREYERRNVCRVYNLIKRFNQWDVTYKKDGLRLEPIIPATILTTLDTGAGTKPVMLGAQPKTNNNAPDQNNG